MNQHDDAAYAPTLTSLPRYQEPPTAEFAAVPAVAQPAREPKNGFGITTFICGIAGIVLSLVPILCIPALISGLVGFGFGWGATKRISAKTADNKWMTRLGFALSILAIPCAIYGIYVVNKAIGDFQTAVNDIGATPAS